MVSRLVSSFIIENWLNSSSDKGVSVIVIIVCLCNRVLFVCRVCCGCVLFLEVLWVVCWFGLVVNRMFIVMKLS